jgi:glycolate oxidase iron-sulfur subunit
VTDVAVLPPAETPLARARHGLDACVHCGFCLQACPTYLALEDENDSPRGRLLLMRAVVEGTLSSDDETVRNHIDRCLGCRACETVCPSGVPYGELLEATRATIIERRPLPMVARIVLWLFARRSRLAAAIAVARVLRGTRIAALLSGLPGRAGFGMAMLASTTRPGRSAPWKRSRRAPDTGSARPTDEAQTRPRGRAAILRGCVMDGLFRETNRATVRAVRRAGYEIVDVLDQGCCGALHAHAGDLAGARALARANVAAFARSGASVIVSNAAGCGAMLETYGHLLADEPEWAERAAQMAAAAQDVSEVVAPTLRPAPRAPAGGAGDAPVRVAYDPPCHLLHAQRVSEPPLALLAAIPGIDVVPLADGEQCCGAAGIYNLLEPAISESVLAPKLAHIAASGASWVVTGNPGCLMQIGAGLRRAGSRVRVLHPIDLLDRMGGGR